MDWCNVFLDWKNTVKMSIIPDTIYRFNIIFIKLPMAFFTESQQQQKMFKFVWRHRP